jgi:hypothetical protein
MSDRIPPTNTNREEIYRLANALLSQEISEADARRLEDLVVNDPMACNWYVEFMCDAYNLHVIPKGSQHLAACSLLKETPTEHEEDGAQPPQDDASPLCDNPPVAICSPVNHLLWGWPLVHLAALFVIAAATFGIGVLVGSVRSASHPEQVAERLPEDAESRKLPDRAIQSIGRITDLIDCQWADAGGQANRGDFVPLGRKYVLSSGLLEISYDIGAKVILQGPATYEVESAKGGLLSTGKLTVKAATEEAKGFTVRTPTAIVTDLGTEFGVGVDKQGGTTSHIFRGQARLNVLADSGKPNDAGQLLHENESAQVDRQNLRSTLVMPASRTVDFVREIPKSVIKTFDLVDIVAGGDGFSGHRGASIDPTTGRRNTEAFIRNITIDKSVLLVNPGGAGMVEDRWAIGDRKFHRVEELPFVDGVFIPDGSQGPITVDSAGHLFTDCPTTLNVAPFLFWAGGAIPNAQFPITTTVKGIDYARNGNALLHMHANLGITFDLNAVRKAHPHWTIRRFLAIAANMELRSEAGTDVSADYWVLVDGRVRSYRCRINACDGAFPISIPINANDCYLTLVSTDGGNGINCDLITFIDPQLELSEENYRPASPNALSLIQY